MRYHLSLQSDIQSRGIKVLFVSNANPESIQRFMEPFDINSKNFIFFQILQWFLAEMFGIHGVPVNIYR